MRIIVLVCAVSALAASPAFAKGGGGGGHDNAASSHGGNYYSSGQGYYGGPPRWAGDTRYYNGLPTQGRPYAQ